MKTILVIEDESSITEMLVMLLESEGYEVLTAEDGQAGVECLARQRPDLVLSDVMMPKLDGRKVVAVMRANPEWKTIPIVLMSAGVDYPQDLAGVIDGFLHKPFYMDELLAVFARILR